MKKYTCHNLAETEKVAQDFLAGLKKEDKATVVGLKGDLGAGKTAFTKLVVKNLGIKISVTSPTFVIEKKYKITAPPKDGADYFREIIHIDAYRLKDGSDLLRLDWVEIIADPNNLILVEWPEIIADIWQPEFKILQFKFIDEQTREIIVN